MEVNVYKYNFLSSQFYSLPNKKVLLSKTRETHTDRRGMRQNGRRKSKSQMRQREKREHMRKEEIGERQYYNK